MTTFKRGRQFEHEPEPNETKFGAEDSPGSPLAVPPGEPEIPAESSVPDLFTDEYGKTWRRVHELVNGTRWIDRTEPA